MLLYVYFYVGAFLFAGVPTSSDSRVKRRKPYGIANCVSCSPTRSSSSAFSTCPPRASRCHPSPKRSILHQVIQLGEQEPHHNVRWMTLQNMARLYQQQVAEREAAEREGKGLVPGGYLGRVELAIPYGSTASATTTANSETELREEEEQR
jgi:hypothetical protein